MESKLPKITIHDGADGVKNLYENIFEEVINNGYVSCKLFASNTISSQSGKADTVGKYANDFFDKMQAKKIHIETFIGNGIWLMESVGKTKNIEELRNLPAGNESIQIYIAGSCVYFMIFKDIPFGIKFDSEELAQTLHFLLDHLKVQ